MTNNQAHDSNRKLRLIVIGNGCIAASASGELFVNRHTGKFLLDVKKTLENLRYVEFVRNVEGKGFLQEFDLRTNGIPVAVVSTRSPLSKARDLCCLAFSLRAVDFAYIFFPGSLGRATAMLCTALGVPYAFYVRGEHFSEHGLDGILLRKAEFALTVSPLLADRLRDSAMIVELIRPMTDVMKNDFRQPASRPTSRRRPRLLYVGRVEERKGCHDLIDMARDLKCRSFEFSLRVVGDGPALPELRQEVRDSGLESFVEFAGQIDSLDKLSEEYENADVFVFPSHDEGFPRVLLEAMARSLPVFSTMVGGIPGLLIDEHNCFAIPVHSGSAAAVVIQKRLDDTQSVQRIAAQGYLTAQEVLLSRHAHHKVLLRHLEI